jgi:hypothetical protein
MRIVTVEAAQNVLSAPKTEPLKLNAAREAVVQATSEPETEPTLELPTVVAPLVEPSAKRSAEQPKFAHAVNETEAALKQVPVAEPGLLVIQKQAAIPENKKTKRQRRKLAKTTPAEAEADGTATVVPRQKKARKVARKTVKAMEAIQVITKPSKSQLQDTVEEGNQPRRGARQRARQPEEGYEYGAAALIFWKQQGAS